MKKSKNPDHDANHNDAQELNIDIDDSNNMDNADSTDNAGQAEHTDYINQTASLLNDLQRTRADFENYRKQVEAQKSLAMSAAKQATVAKILPLIDDFERALSIYPDQLAPLRKNLDKTLASLGLSRIASEPGTEFNPDFHEAISVEDDTSGDVEIISETLRPGYLYDGSVIRAAMVKVKHK